MPLAHSADLKRNIHAQDYSSHIEGTVSRATQAAARAARYGVRDGERLKNVVALAARFHDLGKLDEQNQDVLSGKVRAKKLPVQHTDAGTAHLLNELSVVPAAVLVRSHHIGLPDFVDEQNRTDEHVLRDESVLERVNQTLQRLIETHKSQCLSEEVESLPEYDVAGDSSLFFRVALSCLADGDHTDTAINYGEQTADEVVPELRPIDRLAALDRYTLSLVRNSDRSRLRSEVYGVCRDAVVEENIASCDSPVGTGKTTAVMAHLLAQAEKRHLRRIIVVLPFTNIITQSVETYREALVLDGENPKEVVAELHHRADFQDIRSRQFTALWKAPIIVTTAVSFFETLASNTPARLRRLHNLPGSAVFVDESHAALPAKLLPLAWRWIKGFAREWGCYWVLASGSLNRFWSIEEFDEENIFVPEIMSTDLRHRLAKFEQERITYRYHEEPFGVIDLVEWITSLSGPRIVILNTVQSTAVVASEYKRLFGRSSVEHLSTALTPSDRDRTLARVKSRLANVNDTEWTLVATSCVEAGVDLSFKTGVREVASLVSLLQVAGRVNRHEYVNAETVWTITLKEEKLLKRHPGMKDSSQVLLDLILDGYVISSNLCTNALKREIRLAGTFPNSLIKSDKLLQFPQVEKNFQVIASDTRTVVIGEQIIDKLENYLPVNWRDIQESSVQIWGYRLADLRIPEVAGHRGLYKWTYDYDDFIGYMSGMLSVDGFKQGVGDLCVI